MWVHMLFKKIYVFELESNQNLKTKKKIIGSTFLQKPALWVGMLMC